MIKLLLAILLAVFITLLVDIIKGKEPWAK